MTLLGIDLGGTKLAAGVFNESGKILSKEIVPLEGRKGKDVGELITEAITKHLKASSIESIGVCVPGISRIKSGTVWAPNIPGWDDYPLMDEIKQATANVSVTIDSDRACYILGEHWQGAAKQINDAIFLAVGTGIGAGILVNGKVLRGAHDIAGAVGWMALNRPFKNKYTACGCFEYHASGEGIAKMAREILHGQKDYSGELKKINPENITASNIFSAFEKNDLVAVLVIQQCIECWGMAVANLVSIFNPEKIIFGGGIFGPAVKFIDAIGEEAAKWAQPISITQVSLEPSALGGDAGMYGAGFLALQNLNHQTGYV
ncbi:MAG TPA: ROK family protein [Chitinophagaceae bacterium]|nr:ROK family protein [Chitinophagaceae bacterium]